MAPTEFLAKCQMDLKNLGLSTENDNEIFKNFFIGALPDTVKAILSGNNTQDLTELAKIADNIIKHLRPSASLFNINKQETANTATSNNISNEQLSQRIDTLTSQLSNLASSICAIAQQKQASSSSPSHRSRRSSITHSDTSSNAPRRFTGICYYHSRFDNNARCCRPGCRFPNKQSEILMKDECVYHSHFKNASKRCAEGCKHYETKN